MFVLQVVVVVVGCCHRHTDKHRVASLEPPPHLGMLRGSGVRPQTQETGFCKGNALKKWKTSELKGRIVLEQRHPPFSAAHLGEVLASLGCSGPTL